MAGDIDDVQTFGERLQRIRERRGLSRVVLAGLVGRSPSWVKKAEKQNVMPDLDMLVRLSRALRLKSVEELVGPMEVPLNLVVRTDHELAEPIRRAILSWDPVAHDGPAVPGGVLRRRVREAMAVWHLNPSPRQATAPLLPSLITEARHSVRTLEGQDRRDAAAALVEAYTLAEHWLSWIGDRSLMMVLADRAMHAAEVADDPHVMAEAAWAWGNVLRYIDSNASISLVNRAAQPLRQLMDGDRATEEQAAMWGSLQLHNAITHAQSGREGEAQQHLDDAAKTARRLPAGWQHPVTVFAPFNVSIHQVSVQTELCKGDEGTRLALAIDPDTIPGPYRRSRLWLDAARASWTAGDQLGAATALDNACRVSVENMRFTPTARTLAGNLVDRGGLMIAPQARRIAHELGVIA
ncbi:helix-turn-helix domain-containing protein [Allonocardiopsis opalescens]|uniref:Helix-turn-helix protein n=1 Tax=Allonocardiopsis opalescens TaxID=1144618 RepID=A0A2T0PZ53_9ACTN|nr:helix-turn-helix transcriptional regulator [Allonocardiopsis opalescens]PRX96824.1 helix-turn-helix protein [Allonocardiopsis opalescens]